MDESKYYKVAPFFDLPVLAVLCRGASLSHVRKIHNDFDYCLLVGQFNNVLRKELKCLLGKKIVQVINKSTTQTDRKLCKRYNIQDLQCAFDGWADGHMSSGRRKLFRKIVKSNPWLSVHEAPHGIRERRGYSSTGGPIVDWCTTGIYAIDLAAFFRAKQIIIAGLDFYEADYFVREKVHVSNKKNKKRGPEMLKMFDRIVTRDHETEFCIYTKSTHVVSRNNTGIHIIK